LRQYYEYWVAFNRIDTDSDRRICKGEFTKAVPTIKKWGINITNPSQTFAEIDTDKAGMILFDEFV
jgi:Ca2+-binding EF-hand superfamily protein